jgi:hypothetical protein
MCGPQLVLHWKLGILMSHIDRAEMVQTSEYECRANAGRYKGGAELDGADPSFLGSKEDFAHAISGGLLTLLTTPWATAAAHGP